MPKISLLLPALFCSLLAYAQNDFFILKKGRKKIEFFKKDSYITFQLKNREWYTGYITAVQHDSFYVTRVLIHYTMYGADTSHFSGFQVAMDDVYGMPRKKEELVYRNDHVKIIYGNESFVYVKNGLLFQLAGGGYVLLNGANDLIKNKSPFANNKSGLFIGAAMFLFGELLHLNYRPTLRMGKRYHLEYISLQNLKDTRQTRPSPLQH